MDAVLEKVLAFEERTGRRKRKRRKDAEVQLRHAVGAIVGNLLAAWASDPPLPTSRTLNVNSLTGEDIRPRTLIFAMNAMKALGFMFQRKGGRSKDGYAGLASRFWPSPRLMQLAAVHGVDRETAKADFRPRQHQHTGKKPPKVRDPLRLMAIPPHPNARRSKRLPIDPHDELAAALRSQVMSLNAFAATIEVQGCPPPRWFRQFLGDFRLYGRLHAVGDGNYQSMKLTDRLNIRIGGEPVVEIDIGSSLLTFMHSLFHLPLPKGDLYALPGIPRDVAKAAVNITLGNGRPVRRWPVKALSRMPELRDYSAPVVMAAVIARHPFISEPWRIAEPLAHIADPRRILIHLLMGLESEVMLEAIEVLRGHGILALPMHDGLIVPASAEALACELIRAAGERVAGVELRLKVDRP